MRLLYPRILTKEYWDNEDNNEIKNNISLMRAMVECEISYNAVFSARNIIALPEIYGDVEDAEHVYYTVILPGKKKAEILKKEIRKLRVSEHRRQKKRLMDVAVSNCVYSIGKIDRKSRQIVVDTHNVIFDFRIELGSYARACGLFLDSIKFANSVKSIKSFEYFLHCRTEFISIVEHLLTNMQFNFLADFVENMFGQRAAVAYWEEPDGVLRGIPPISAQDIVRRFQDSLARRGLPADDSVAVTLLTSGWLRHQDRVMELLQILRDMNGQLRRFRSRLQ